MDGAEVGAFVGWSVVAPHTRGRRSSTSAGRIASPLGSVACLASNLDRILDLFSFDLPEMRLAMATRRRASTVASSTTTNAVDYVLDSKTPFVANGDVVRRGGRRRLPRAAG